MNTSWLDQRAAIIRDGREGNPTLRGAKRSADLIAEQFPDLDRRTIGAVLIAHGAILSDACRQFEESNETPQDIVALLCCLTDTAGEYLYAPEGGTS